MDEDYLTALGLDPTDIVIGTVGNFTRKKNQQWGLGVLVSSLSPLSVSYLVGLTPEQRNQPLALLLAYGYGRLFGRKGTVSSMTP